MEDMDVDELNKEKAWYCGLLTLLDSESEQAIRTKKHIKKIEELKVEAKLRKLITGG